MAGTGYTPLFASLTTGTLCGRWPDIGLWPIVLSLSDRHGIVDVTPAYLAGVTGLPLADVVACMARFCQPDPYSRSPQEAGARLVLLDEHRDWGWRIVNHGLYREKARKQAFDAQRTADGRNAARMAERRTREDPTRPAKTRTDPPSDSNTNTDKNKKVPTEPVPRERDGGPAERVFEHWRGEFGHPNAQLDTKRRRVIEAALKAYDEATLQAAISGYRQSPHHMGQNDRRTVYDDIELFLRDAKHIEAGLTFARGPPAPAMSAVGRAREKLRNGNGNGRVVSEQFGEQGTAGLGAAAGLLRRIPDS